LKIVIQNAERVVSITSITSHPQAGQETCLRALSDLSDMYGLLYEYDPHDGARYLDLGAEKGMRPFSSFQKKWRIFQKWLWCTSVCPWHALVDIV